MPSFLLECEITHNQSDLLKGRKNKKLTVITLVIFMLAVAAVPAFAAGGLPADRGASNNNGNDNPSRFGLRNPYALLGTIADIDSTARAVTVTVVCGNRLVKPYFGQDVPLQTTDNTHFLLRNPDGTVTLIKFKDLSVGRNVSSHGIL
jgi:hypothetical protein